jgi:acetate kinase
MRILVLNSGSSSLKFQVIDVPSGKSSSPSSLLSGSVTGIGGEAIVTIKGQSDQQPLHRSIQTYDDAVGWIVEQFDSATIEAVGHRVVHGGTRFTQPVRITDAVMAELEPLNELAPLHNPPSLAVIRAAQARLGRTIPMVAIFDTAFHADMPATGSSYAIASALAERQHVRRFGFHGIAHAAMAHAYADAIGRSREEVTLITLQLGNGCSATAVRNGRSVDTSMGMTPLEGLVMGTRSGDIDPSVVTYLARREGVDAETVERWLNERSGLRGVSGLSHDIRELLHAEERGHPQAALAIELFCYRVRKYIGAYLAVLNGAEAIVFGGGIGEHAPAIRERICRGMEWCGIRLDPTQNAHATDPQPGQVQSISLADAGVPVYVAGVDEEAVIAGQTRATLSKETGQGAM